MGYDNLANYFRNNFNLSFHHKYSLNELESMIPWEKYVYIDLLNSYVKQKEESERDQFMTMRSQKR